MVSRPTPVNHSRRADRVDAWNAEADAGRRYRPQVRTGPGVMFEWIRALHASDLDSTTRHVGTALALNGNADGSRIFPGVRELARQTALCQRVVCEKVGLLVRRGFLLRKARRGDTAGGCGFEYLLRWPEVLIAEKHWKPVLLPDAHRASTRSAPKAAGADQDSQGADGGCREVLDERQPTTVLPPSNHSAPARRSRRGAQ